jgi:hypothetical protein
LSRLRQSCCLKPCDHLALALWTKVHLLVLVLLRSLDNELVYLWRLIYGHPLLLVRETSLLNLSLTGIVLLCLVLLLPPMGQFAC